MLTELLLNHVSLTDALLNNNLLNHVLMDGVVGSFAAPHPHSNPGKTEHTAFQWSALPPTHQHGNKVRHILHQVVDECGNAVLHHPSHGLM